MDTDWTQTQIAEAVGVSTQTLSTWKKEGKWEDIKADLEIGTTNLRRTLSEQYQKIKNGGDPTVNLKALEMIMEMMLKLESTVNIKNASAIFSAFNKFLVYEQEIEGQDLINLTNYQQGFIEFLIQNPIR